MILPDGLGLGGEKVKGSMEGELGKEAVIGLSEWAQHHKRT